MIKNKEYNEYTVIGRGGKFSFPAIFIIIALCIFVHSPGAEAVSIGGGLTSYPLSLNLESDSFTLPPELSDEIPSTIPLPHLGANLAFDLPLPVTSTVRLGGNYITVDSKMTADFTDELPDSTSEISWQLSSTYWTVTGLTELKVLFFDLYGGLGVGWYSGDFSLEETIIQPITWWGTELHTLGGVRLGLPFLKLYCELSYNQPLIFESTEDIIEGGGFAAGLGITIDI